MPIDKHSGKVKHVITQHNNWVDYGGGRGGLHAYTRDRFEPHRFCCTRLRRYPATRRGTASCQYQKKGRRTEESQGPGFLTDSSYCPQSKRYIM
jgi:hypothetical protein